MVDERGLEDALFRSAAAGNEGAFSQLVRAYRLQVVRTAYGILGSVTEADDVGPRGVHIKAWKACPT